MAEPQLDRERYVLGDASQHVGFLNCERISERSHIHGWHVDSHYHEGLAQLFFFADGEILGQLDFEGVRIKAPALIWMPALVSHGFDYPENTLGWVITLPSVNLARLAHGMPWIDTWLSRPAAIFGEDSRDGLAQLRPVFEEIEAEHGLWGEERSAILEALFRILLIRFHRMLRDARSRETRSRIPHLALVSEFEALVDRDHLKNRTVSDYAAELSVTSTYLTRCVKAATGRTAGEIIHDRLVLEARRLIVFTELSIAEIAYKLHFSTPSYFTRFFTQLTGEKPTTFRSRMRANRS
ncbi:AraC family transcriptional regulator (plasmid) [Rhizobium sp. CB3090]|uniref:AraC family transcriptional regulator n=1 Tax=Rhizobium sp. CB3090 TaxID=3039156 RepID=UPI0024B25907|nr:AraC family transcriptional regulator [Rhizobium sp. CB3090]WFU12875.1 AraC family transcriptional regulator [Rhizobium sp. CB3090]